ncbi:Cytosolic carboxypeptidase 2 [Clonorchis sinensis]|uniref:Cytosolic carboxypeptidase 2 n=1 Tax=Clonorchis sinensis TaxID=79923 RepID=A0A8T1MAH4_CLOSI|nr:Cytosolic carboxypeptidase 2 [Clonorchis sinensis]
MMTGKIEPTDVFIEKLRIKSSDVFKTKQIYYALLDDGKLDAKLSQPRELDPLRIKGNANWDINWPLNMEVIPEPVRHVNRPPEKREPLYFATGMELEPPLVDADPSLVVYCYEPNVGKYFGASKTDGKVAEVYDPSPNSEILCFESRFESGNLSKAVCTGRNEYQLYLQPDLYTEKYTQWFYFRVSNMRAGRKYRFTIVNMYKATSLFCSGMRPLMYSEKSLKLYNRGWHRVGEDIRYYRTPRPEGRKMPTDNAGDSALRKQKDGRPTLTADRVQYSLTWTCQFPFTDDVVYFAACYPYTYTQLKEYLHSIDSDPSKRRYCQQRVLCQTLAGNSVPFLTISEPGMLCENSSQRKDSTTMDKKEPDTSKKRCVVITARVHPGETQSSWMVQGLIDFLVSENPDAELLRSNFVFKIIPMLNPDGVIVGNYRCSLSGCDLNRKYHSDLKRFFPTVWHAKEMVMNTMQDYAVLVYCDFHGHSRKQQMFIYGCRSLNPETRFHDRVFPAMLSKNAPNLFDYSKCRFAVQKEKEGTGRVVMWRTGILNSYTLEATFCGKSGEVKEDNYHFNTRDFEEMGRQFCDTLLDYCDPDQKKCNYILTELKSDALAKRLARYSGELGEVNESNLGCSTDDSSDTGSDSSNCDDVPAYYAYVLQNSPKRPARRKPRKKRKAGSQNAERITHCPVCQKNTPGISQISSSNSKLCRKEMRTQRPRIQQQVKEKSLVHIQHHASGYLSDSALASSTRTEALGFVDQTGKGHKTLYLEVPSPYIHHEFRDRTASNVVSSDEQTSASNIKMKFPKLTVSRGSPRFITVSQSRDLNLPRIDLLKQAFSRTGRRSSSAPNEPFHDDQHLGLSPNGAANERQRQGVCSDISRSNPAEAVGKRSGDQIESPDSFPTTMTHPSTDESETSSKNIGTKQFTHGTKGCLGYRTRISLTDPKLSVTYSNPSGSIGALDQYHESIRNAATKTIKIGKLAPLWSNSHSTEDRHKPKLQLIGRSITVSPVQTTLGPYKMTRSSRHCPNRNRGEFPPVRATDGYYWSRADL